ncbi:MAG: formate dehydrogenase subunit alpha, partial [Chloroflexota bacterium]|nr:formate dehydrogenase subunit alpha [Chloroflexota bacterium]
VQRLRMGKEPLHQSAEWRVLSQLAGRLGTPFSYRNPAAVMNEIAERVPQYAGMTYGRIGGSGLQWPVVEATGSHVLYADGAQRWQFMAVEG